jgi:hypothetical protein
MIGHPAQMSASTELAKSGQANRPSTSHDPSSCTSCGARIAEDMAFCSRCGVKVEGNLSVDQQIELAALIKYLGRYGELCSALAMGPELQRQADDARDQITARRDWATLRALEGKMAEARAHEASVLRDCEEAKSHILAFDAERIRKVRDLVVANATVSDSIKNGLRIDTLGIFDSSGGRTYHPIIEREPDRRPAPKASAHKPTRIPGGYIFCVILVCVGGISLIGGIGSFLNQDADSTLLLGGIGVGLLVFGGAGIANACPNCRLLFTSEILIGISWRLLEIVGMCGIDSLDAACYQRRIPWRLKPPRHVRRGEM